MTIILLTYVNRSGSTYLANLISASESVCVCPEGDRLVSLFLESPDKAFQLNARWKAKLSYILKSDKKVSSWGIGDDVFSKLRDARRNIDAFVAILRYYQLRQKPDANSILFKAERLVDLFEGIDRHKGSGIRVKYLSLIRDPRAIYASQKRTQIPGSNKKMSRNSVYTAIFWNHFMRRNKVNMGLLDNHTISYREMVIDLDGTLAALSGYLEQDLPGLAPGEGDLAGRLPEGHNIIHPTVNMLPDPVKIDQWREEISPEEISLIEGKCRRFMMEGGFEITRQVTTPPARKYKLIYFTIVYHADRLLHIVGFHLKRFLAPSK